MQCDHKCTSAPQKTASSSWQIPLPQVLHLPETNRHFVSEDGEPLKEVKTRSGISLNARPIRDVWCHVYVMPHCGLKRAAIGGDANAEVCIRKPNLSVGTCEDLGSEARRSFRKEGIFKPAFFVIERGWELRDQHKITTI